jgi:MoaA/NifB/PqqE/SkfB family radical SAM enzyme
MPNKINYILYGLGYLFNTKVLGKDKPFVGALVINEKCNLKCNHCQVSNRPLQDLTYEDTMAGLKTFYDMGIRSLAIGGGEPFLWEDGGRKIEDIVKLSREMGFKLIVIYTNGTFPLKISADAIFVSLDGLKDTNDNLRGVSYDKIIQNIRNSKHSNLWINFTINNKNFNEIESFCKEIENIKNIKGVMFYFHTPYYGIDELFLNLENRKKIIEKIIDLKKSGFKILNSYACLRAVYNNDWQRPAKMCYVYANNKLFQCCRSIGNEEACDNCGYLSYAEIIHASKLRPSSIKTALRFLPLENKEREIFV